MGKLLMLEMIAFYRQYAQVKLIHVPGNHDPKTSFALAQYVEAYYHHTDDVVVDASPSPYKFQRWGCNLIGFEHGKHVKPIRLAALMANERPRDWYETAGGYREWHRGDQHRKGTQPNVVFEEQGVSVEHLPSLTVPNAWHRMKSFNWQQRGGVGFIWDDRLGPVARIPVCLNSYTGLPIGDEPEEGSAA
jgi:hypothetical protein